MKICPKCTSEHKMSGVYCSRKCANSRKFSENSKKKKSEANKKYWQSLSENDKIEKGKILSELSPYSTISYFESLMTEEWNILGIQSKRLRVIIEQNGQCNRCGITHWQKERITLEYEHKDGNNENNSRENVEALCPNCHSLTSTWRGRKNKIRQRQVEKYIDLNNSLSIGSNPIGSTNI